MSWNPLSWVTSSEFLTGKGHPSKPDTLNRALRAVLSLSGFDVDGPFPGLTPYVNPINKGAQADGTTDEVSAVTLAEAAAGAAGTEFFPGTYRFASNYTFAKSARIHPGAYFKADNGVTVTLPAGVEAGNFAWIDQSSGGRVLPKDENGKIYSVWYKQVPFTLPAPTVAPVADIGDNEHGNGPLFGEGSMLAGYKYRIYVAGVGHRDRQECRQLTALSPYVEITPQYPSLLGVDVRACFPMGYKGKGFAILWQRETSIGSGVFTSLKRAQYAPNKHDGGTNARVFAFADCNETNDGYMAAVCDEDSNVTWNWIEGGFAGGSTTLTAGIGTTDATIPIASNANIPHDPSNTWYLPNGGIVQIDSEYISYTGTDGTNLYGCVRGMFGTTAATHSSAATVTAVVLDVTGSPLPNPSAAPLTRFLHAMPPGVAFTAKYTFCDDTLGAAPNYLPRETAASPVSNSITTLGTVGGTTAGGPVTLYFAELAPSGAVRRAIYLSTDGVNYYFQRYCGVGEGAVDVHTWSTAGRLLGDTTGRPSGSASNTVAPEQQAWDANDLLGGGWTTVCRIGVITMTAPFIQRMSNNTVPGSKLVGAAAIDNLVYRSPTRFSYNGNTDGVELHVSNVAACFTEGVSFWDNNNKAKVGLRLFDLTGGGSFFNVWDKCAWYCNRTDSVGLISSNESVGANGGHTASEQTFRDCKTRGMMRGIHLSGQQTANIRFYGGQNESGGGTGSGPSRVVSGNTVTTSACSSSTLIADGVQCFFEAVQHASGHRVHVVTWHLARRSGGSAKLMISKEYFETNNADDMGYLDGSEMETIGALIEVSGTEVGSSITGFYDVLLMGPHRFSVSKSYLRNHVFVDNWAATYDSDRDSTNWSLFERSRRFAPPSGDYPNRTFPALVVTALGLINGVDDKTVVAIEKLDASGTVAPGSIPGSNRVTVTLTIPGLEFGDVFMRPALFGGTFGSYGPGLIASGLEITHWEVSAADTLKITILNTTIGAVDPGTLNYRIRGERTRKAHVTQFTNDASA